MKARSKRQTQTEDEGTFKETARHRQNMKARSKRQTQTEYEGTFKETDTDII